MTAFFLKIHDYLAQHRIFSVAVLLVLLVVAVLLSLRLRFQENVADFLPQNEENARYTAVYNDLGDQGEITLLFRAKDSLSEDAEDEIMSAIDDFEANWDGEGVLRCRMEDTDALEAIDFIRDNIALFLTPEDYRRADSLLEEPGYVEASVGSVKQMLSQPLGGLVVEGIANDPLNLFSPALQRLQQLAASEDYQMVDGYVFDAAGSRGYAFLESPYDASDTKHNATIAKQIQCAIDSTQAQHPSIQVSAVGAALIAVTNATQIKYDSFLAIALALLLIAVILFFAIGRKRNLLWMCFAIAFGWLFALGVVALFRPTISIIVIGIGSVLVGIAVNYPLHFIDHIKDHPNRREALRDMVDPLVIGNITTVSAFACLLFVKADAMRDLGLFGSLMLVGTILFVVLFLPLWAKSGTSHSAPKEVIGSWQRIMSKKVRTTRLGMWLSQYKVHYSRVRWAHFILVVGLTVFFAIRSTRTSFDADLHHINYMTAQQEADLELLESSLQEDTCDLIYMVAEGANLEEALNASAEQTEGLEPTSITPLLPTKKQQEERLQLWSQFVAHHPTLAQELTREAVRQGFTADAFAPFVRHLDAEYEKQSVEAMAPILHLGSGYVLDRDSSVCIVSFLHAPYSQTETLKARLRQRSHEDSQFVFSQSDVGSNLVSALSEDFNYILYVCGFVVFFFLWLSFGSLELSLLAFLPLTVGWLWILGIMDLTAVQFNIVNIILATFIFGQGDDYTIFITEGLVQEYAYGKQRLQGFRRSVVLSASLMLVGMGTLIVARHPAMKSLAEVALIGMFVVVLMACYLPPLIYHWMTTKRGRRREVPVTLQRLLYTFVSLLVFVVFAFVLVTPLTLLYKWVGRDSERKRLRYHRIICWSNRQALRLLPGVKHRLVNPHGETFDKPAVIIANHQSHLDLLCMLMLHPKMVIVTNDWVWRNPVYGVIIRYAEFYPASDGYGHNLERMRSLVQRGYSVMIFPEGTRSRDCTIGRFHKGAFQLAQDLDVDLLPVYLHGAGHVMPKDDILLRKGSLTVEIGERVRCQGDVMECAKNMRRHYENHYAQLKSTLENEEYFKPLVRYQYLYKGREVWRRKPGQAELLRALSHPDEQVVFAPDNRDDALLMQHTVVRPRNLIVRFPQSSDRPSQLIIGGGLSGLFTGALLAQDGYPVTVLEKNSTIGGGLQCFRRGNTVFPTGMHVFGGFQQGGILRDICTRLGVMEKLQLQPTDSDCFDEVYLPDGSEYRLPMGLNHYESYLSKCFPHEKDSIHAYLVTLQRLWQEELDMLPRSEEFLMPYDQLIDSYFSDPKLRKLQRYLAPLMGAEEGKTPAYILAMITLSHINGSYQFVGGSQQLADVLSEVIVAQGGKVVPSEEVCNVVVKEKRVVEVVTRKGNHYSADNFISSIHPQCLLQRMDSGVFSPAFRKRVMEAPQSMSAFMAFVEYDEALPYINHPIYLFAAGHDMVLLSPCKGQLVILEQMPFSKVAPWADTTVGHRGDDYRNWKQHYADELIDSIGTLYPPLRAHVRLVEASTPLTIRDYFGNPQGCLYGNAKDCNQMASSQLSVRTKISNLFLTGQNINLHGLVGVAITAQETARVVNQMNEQKMNE